MVLSKIGNGSRIRNNSQEHLAEDHIAHAGNEVSVERHFTCTHCGNTRYMTSDRRFSHCPKCGGKEWIRSIEH
ncbi:zinc ribbon-containing protein [Pedobacter sp. R-06]|uniref:zinc ribbon-containing protein n=1 Tax=Pedobacter sp. R-06 TaxID=3404051 RepID=UPI003CECA9B1